MKIELPRIIEDYIDASNRHDVKAIVACFSDAAVVHDESQDHRGKPAIEDWIRTTIEKYKFQFKPLAVQSDEASMVVAIEVSGTFDGSPVSLDYRFVLKDEKILSLGIE